MAAAMALSSVPPAGAAVGLPLLMATVNGQGERSKHGIPHLLDATT